MNENELTLTFKITRYHVVKNDDNIPNEMNLIIKRKINKNDNFIEVIENVAAPYRIGDKLNYYLEGIYETLWSEHFDGEIIDNLLKNMNLRNYEYINTKIAFLDKQFNLKDKEIKIVIQNEESRYFMKFYFHIDTKYEKLPHVHCKCCGLERVIDLNTLEFIENTFLSESITKRAISIVHRYRTEFREYFETLSNGGEELLAFRLFI